MKAILRKMFPDLYLLKNNQENRARVVEAVKATWWAIPQDLIDSLIESMPRRMKAVRKVHG
jgi:hypothetical protein